mmetsp:Transcript_31069/g.82313  ORF Transcript_31069/g.82313 Transcript_31069/m.82313 type:complete len:217 (+) Transcript_31069:457-1107(+)
MHVELLVDAADDLLQLQHHLLDAGLPRGVVVLDVAQELREAPVGAGLHRAEDGLVNQVDVQLVQRSPQLGREQDHHERRDEVVDALHVAARGVPHRPDVEHTLHQPLHPRVAEERQAGRRAREVHFDLPKDDLIGSLVALAAGFFGRADVVTNAAVPSLEFFVFVALLGHACRLPVANRWEVAQKHHPCLRPHRGVLLRGARPEQFAQLCDVNGGR